MQALQNDLFSYPLSQIDTTTAMMLAGGGICLVRAGIDYRNGHTPVALFHGVIGIIGIASAAFLIMHRRDCLEELPLSACRAWTYDCKNFHEQSCTFIGCGPVQEDQVQCPILVMPPALIQGFSSLKEMLSQPADSSCRLDLQALFP